ncbi:MAG: hypothetical protein R2789_04690 [Microthrixaceae bacterium]
MRALVCHPSDSGGVGALVRCVDDWTLVRLAQECATLACELANGSGGSVLRVASVMTCVAIDPPHLESPWPSTVHQLFPWGIGALRTSRFLLIDGAHPRIGLWEQ